MSTPNVNTAPKSAAPTQNQDRLKTFFDGHEEEKHASRWDDLWKSGDFLPWDRGFTNPALVDALNERKDIFGAPTNANGSRKRALVPGYGRGYDLVLLAAHGYDAYGIEVSENAVKAAEEWLKNPGEGKEGEYTTRDAKVGRGVAKGLLGDFFKDDWATEIGGIGEGFDLIYDCTFLSALPPSLRAPWALRMSQLLSPTGVLVCLEFPTHKPPKSGGPPWALPSVVYEELFKRPGEEIRYDEDGKVICEDRAKNKNTLSRVAYWKPARTHQVGIINGEVKDWVSVWKHKE
ncbi:S-adenosyl-L-methionine-dependent methyltransferase [Dendryphion nanum]|uniref:S-adenosyl-L-methionine-dependent methyltransferase n=1 Tax=Dendryphion nanum TaxID=256645 RepID=A0A9P9E2L7_9PLEO|nr:S-adenosyl-L-methionine-dependent methyltransferase [Dendryphion nanum]